MRPGQIGAKTGSGMRVQGETQAGSPCAILGLVKDEGSDRFAAPFGFTELCRFLGFRNGLGLLFRLRLGSELLLHLESNGIGIHFVG